MTMKTYHISTSIVNTANISLDAETEAEAILMAKESSIYDWETSCPPMIIEADIDIQGVDEWEE